MIKDYLELSPKLLNDIKNGFLKAVDLIEFLINEANYNTDIIDLKKASLSDLKLNCKYIVNCSIDTDKKLLMLNLK
tara:strand:- start:200 stop:427 length:228 start_codon:yes stop_codon:yes gene_type:complete